MINWLKWFEKERVLTEDYIDLSEKKVFFKLTTNITDLEIENLKKKDYDLLQFKIKQLLIKYGFISDKPPEKETNLFSKEDVEWFEKSKHSRFKKWQRT